ncbi:MAG: phosphoglycerate kinase [Myxococcales bacterium]|nr:phosphoglycerate kinase [Myxococcales bacterium]
MFGVEELERGPEGTGGQLAGKRVLVRVDFDVPMRGDEVVDDTRIREALPTVTFLVEAGAKVILASHFGHPGGKYVAGCSLEPAGARLAEQSGFEVHLPDDCIGDAPRKVIRDLRTHQVGGTPRGPAQICLLENLRFHKGEEADDDGFARALGELCDVYVNDAFGVTERAHASVYGLPRLMRDRGAGKRLAAELAALGRLVEAPARPFVAVVGGAELGRKVALFESLLGRVDTLVLGGALAHTFLAARGARLAETRVEGDKLALARTLLNKARDAGVEVVLPTDLVVAEGVHAASSEVVAVGAVPNGYAALDVGPATLERYAAALAGARTVLWNGPVGVLEHERFAAGTRRLVELVAQAPGFTVVCGADTARAVRAAGEAGHGVDHVSSGGTAALALLEGKRLPGVEALRVAR